MKQTWGYICPIPMKWNEIYTSLSEVYERCGKNPADKPPGPLISATWHKTPDIMKTLRWSDTIEWAEKHNVHHLIPVLKDEEKFKGLRKLS